jgi:2-keto-4-pentenoate hydratase/2-oxohepta-3-ene-1,7-dioic acid hydratase in catechol pathway
VRLATFLPPGSTEARAGEVRGEAIVAFSRGTVIDRLADRNRPSADGESWPLADVKLLAPVPRPGAIFCIGLNYADHAEEGGREPPAFPIVFLKPSRTSVPPSGPVRCPAVVERLDYEAELVIVMGAEGDIAGYAVANDVSARDLQRREPQWSRAKGADTFCPWGPWVTTADEVPDPRPLRISSRVNGELRQDGTTADLIFGPGELVRFLRETFTLEPGDIILTGTPAGVGAYMDPPQFLGTGDVVTVEIERLGKIEHAIV